MKNTKWIWRVLAVILTLVVLAGVGLAGFRFGVMQSANLTGDGTAFMFHHGRGFDNSDTAMKPGNMHEGSGSHHSNRGHDFGGGRGGFSFFGPIFGLLRLAVLGGLIWLGYTFLKRSGWRVVNVNTSQPVAQEATPVEPEAEEKKDEA